MKLSWKFMIPVLALAFSGCDQDTADEPGFGFIILEFSHQVEGNTLSVDNLQYINAAGNHYLVSEVQYFISEVTLHQSDGSITRLTQDEGFHYVDTDVPESLIWNPLDHIPAVPYDSITFNFGIIADKNLTGIFPNPPESNMFWPDVLGGGYHYMKLNGKWLDTSGLLSAFHLHLGIGQIYDTAGNITGFIHNDFKVTLPQSSFTMYPDAVFKIPVIMNIESWFETPEVYDLNYWGGGIMQNQAAMATVCRNGADVFTTGTIYQTNSE